MLVSQGPQRLLRKPRSMGEARRIDQQAHF
jgi:hypothetical protein